MVDCWACEVAEHVLHGRWPIRVHVGGEDDVPPVEVGEEMQFGPPERVRVVGVGRRRKCEFGVGIVPVTVGRGPMSRRVDWGWETERWTYVRVLLRRMVMLSWVVYVM